MPWLRRCAWQCPTSQKNEGGAEHVPVPLLHELVPVGPAVLPMRSQAVSRRSTIEVMEQEANAFAMELLMPYDWLVVDLQAMHPPLDYESDKRIAGLAKKYGVSEQLMLVRIAALNSEADARRRRKPKA